MDLQHLQACYPEFLKYLKVNGYCHGYIAHFRTELNWILSHSSGNSWNSYQEIFLDRTEHTESPDVIRQKKSMIAALEQFDIYGSFPNSHSKNSLFPRGSYHLLVPEYQALIDHYRQVEEKRGKKTTTIQSEALNTASFLFHLQEKGCHALCEITQDAVISFFRSENGACIKSCSYRKNISAVFKAGVSYKSSECQRILLFLPMLRERRKTIQYLTQVELKTLMDVLRNEKTFISCRNRAICLLLLYYRATRM